MLISIDQKTRLSKEELQRRIEVLAEKLKTIFSNSEILIQGECILLRTKFDADISITAREGSIDFLITTECKFIAHYFSVMSEKIFAA